MVGNQYALTGDSFRAIDSAPEAVDGEIVVSLLPASAIEAANNADRLASVTAQLRASDWSMMPDSGLMDAERDAWGRYRSALRALPEMPDFPDCEWPSPPA